MSLVKHILKNDLYRLRGYLALTLFFFFVSILISGANAFILPGNFPIQSSVETAYSLITILQWILAALTIPALIHSDPITGTTAFWQTRPLSHSDILKSKSIIAVLFFVLLPLVTRAIWLASHHFPVQYIVMAVPESLLAQLFPVLLLLVAALVTRSFSFYALVAGLYITAKLALDVGLLMIHMKGRVPPLELFFSPGSYDVSTLLVSISICGFIILNQVKTRETKRSFILLAIQLIAMFSMQNFSPINLAKKPLSAQRLNSTTLDGISIQFMAGGSWGAFDPSMVNSSYPSCKSFSDTFRFSGIPPGYFGHVQAAKGELQVNDKSYPANFSLPPKAQYYPNSHSITAGNTLCRILDPIRLRRKPDYVVTSAASLLQLSNEEFKEVESFSGTYTSEISLDIYRYVPVATLLLEPGQVFERGSFRVMTESIKFEPTEHVCTIVMKEQDLNLALKTPHRQLWGSRYTYLLVNEQKQEAIFLSPDEAKRNQTPSLAKKMVHLDRITLHSLTSHPLPGFSVFDLEWIKNAKLVLMESQWVAEKKLEYIQDPVHLKASRNAFIPPGVETDKSRNEIKLPRNPTRKQIVEYIQELDHIANIPSLKDGVMSYGRENPIVDQYAKVGPEHLDLLLAGHSNHSFHGSSFYKQQAIEKLAQPKHKELILEHLKTSHGLATIVIKQGWEEDAREILISELESQQLLPLFWIKAIANLNDPATYPPLIEFFIYGSGKSSTYWCIQNLPGIELDDAVSEIWKSAKYGDADGIEFLSAIQMALNHGIVEALPPAGVALGNKSKRTSSHIKSIRKALREHVGKFESDDTFREWVETNLANIRFDPETKMFVVDEI